MAAVSILHDVPAAMVERIERSSPGSPEILGATELQEGEHTVTTVLYRTALNLSHPVAEDGSKQITIRATIFVDGKGQTDLIVSSETTDPPASTEYSQLVGYVDGNRGPRARMGSRIGYLTLDRSGKRETPRVRLRDPRRRSGGQYTPIFERHVEPGAREPLELRCANGRYVPVPAFFAGGAAGRAAP